MCDRPLKGFRIPGETKYKVTSPDMKYVYEKGGKWYAAGDELDPSKFEHGDIIKNYIPIPCGYCLSCRIAKAAEMANRCMLELQYHDYNSFITLTYDPDNIIYTNYTNVSTGETGTSATLFKKHYVDFIKRLRKRYPDNNISYILCGEYGETTARPHYHAIIFGYRPRDLVFYKLNSRLQPLYNSPELQKMWNKGFVVVGDVTKDSCNYVCRYVTKKLYGNYGYEEYQMRGRIPPFIVSSKRPAIGKRWYDDNSDWCLDYNISYSTADGGVSFKAPRYFKKLAQKEGLMIEYTQRHDLLNEVLYKNDLHVSDYNDLERSKQGLAHERTAKARNMAFKRDKL